MRTQASSAPTASCDASHLRESAMVHSDIFTYSAGTWGSAEISETQSAGRRTKCKLGEVSDESMPRRRTTPGG